MPDEISHIIWAYLVLKHPSIKENPDFKTTRGKLAMYFFSILPDFGNLLMLLMLFWVTWSLGMPLSMGPGGMHNPDMEALVMGPVRNIYYAFHSFVTYALLIVVSYVVLRRIYWPLVLGTGLHLFLDLLTHAGVYAIEPLTPLTSMKVNGFLQWGSWEFYFLEAAAFLAYTLWLFRRAHRKPEQQGKQHAI
jgi:hypothetical protein